VPGVEDFLISDKCLLIKRNKISVSEGKELIRGFESPKKEPGPAGTLRAARLLFIGCRSWQSGLQYYSGTGTLDIVFESYFS
jgi:hypothetical protein